MQAGADDYIVQPFDIDELGARVEAHPHREQRKQEQSVVRFFDELCIDYLKRGVTVNGNLIPFSKKEFEIVELLSMNAGQVFDRERIYKAIWGIEGNSSSDTIMEHIRKIRSKLSVYTQHSYIDTVSMRYHSIVAYLAKELLLPALHHFYEQETHPV